MYIQGQLGHSSEIKPSIRFIFRFKNVARIIWLEDIYFFLTLQVFEMLSYMSTHDVW